MGSAELFELCETIPKVQCSESLLYWNQGVIPIALVDISWLKANPAKFFHQWQLDAL